MDLIAQIFIMVLGTCAIWLANSKTKKARFYGALCGLISQPAWFYTSFVNGQWGVFIIAFIYTAAWIKGLIINRKYNED